MKKSSAFVIIGILVVIAIFGAVFFVKGQKYTVTFDSNGGSVVSSVQVKKGDKVSKPSEPTRDGYVFSGWYLNDTLYDFDLAVLEDITLVAKWSSKEDGNTAVKSYTMKFDSNGGSTVNDILVENGVIKELPTPVKDGYKFVGWFNKNNEEVTVGSAITSDETVTAKWEKNTTNNSNTVTKYTVKFNTQGGSKISSVRITSGKTVSKPKDPTRDDYKFVGWYLNGKVYNFNSKVVKNITLVAKWEKVATPVVTPDEPTKPQEPTKPEEPKNNDVISYLKEDIATSIVGQTTLYVTKNGEKVDGYLDITTTSGQVITKKISKSGYVTNKNQIQSIGNARLEK